jgi:hypothetical protein
VAAIKWGFVQIAQPKITGEIAAGNVLILAALNHTFMMFDFS